MSPLNPVTEPPGSTVLACWRTSAEAPGGQLALDPGDVARDLAEDLADAHPGAGRIALLAAEREALPVRRLE